MGRLLLLLLLTSIKYGRSSFSKRTNNKNENELLFRRRKVLRNPLFVGLKVRQHVKISRLHFILFFGVVTYFCPSNGTS